MLGVSLGIGSISFIWNFNQKNHSQTLASPDDEISLSSSPSILVVDDDDGENYAENYFMPALDACGYDYDVHTVPSNENGPASSTMNSYEIVIWTTAKDYGGDGCITDIDEANLATYLENGGIL